MPAHLLPTMLGRKRMVAPKAAVAIVRFVIVVTMAVTSAIVITMAITSAIVVTMAFTSTIVVTMAVRFAIVGVYVSSDSFLPTCFLVAMQRYRYASGCQLDSIRNIQVKFSIDRISRIDGNRSRTTIFKLDMN
eukprot:155598_1